MCRLNEYDILKKQHKWTATYWLHQACSDSHRLCNTHTTNNCETFQLKGSFYKPNINLTNMDLKNFINFFGELKLNKNRTQFDWPKMYI